MEGGALGVRIGRKEAVCGHEVGEKNMFAIMDEAWVTDRGGEGSGT